MQYANASHALELVSTPTQCADRRNVSHGPVVPGNPADRKPSVAETAHTGSVPHVRGTTSDIVAVAVSLGDVTQW